MNWQLNDGYELKAFRNGEALLSPVIKTLKQMSEAMQKVTKSVTTVIRRKQEKFRWHH